MMKNGENVHDINYDEVNDFKENQFRQLLSSNPKYIINCNINAIAAMKMMNHANMGVEKGIKTSATGKPIEVYPLHVYIVLLL